MNDFNDFLAKLPLCYSDGRPASHGFVVWQWDGKQWIVALDFSQPDGIQKSPVEDGYFVGQLRAIVCEAPDVPDGK